MSRIHYTTLFRHRDPHVVLHPLCGLDVHSSAASQPVHAVGRTPIGKKKTNVYATENVTLLWTLMKSDGHWVCGDCRKASLDTKYSCPEIVWDEEWIKGIGMARFETVPEWEKIFDSIFESVSDAANGAFRMERRSDPTVIVVHERVLGIVPPYDRDELLRAYRAAAMLAHPDRGGSNEAMVRVNVARDALLRMVAA